MEEATDYEYAIAVDVTGGGYALFATMDDFHMWLNQK